ncbi:MAG TPA: hypothetical protein PK400_02945 [Phycisphaerales bacterium]|nr:hypothetical protein [Phycisphaerales bacterium]HRQ74586.1 hypothetical protein [Phycisphaerales bacterium]
MTSKATHPEAIASSFVDAVMLEAAPTLTPWFGEQQLRQNVHLEIAAEIKATATDDSIRLIELPQARDGEPRWVIAKVGEIVKPKPAVVVRFRNFPLPDAQAVIALAKDIRAVLGDDLAADVLVFRHGEALLPSAQVYTHYVAGLIDRIHLPANAALTHTVRLEQPDSLDFYPTYAHWYEEFWRRRPHLTDVWVEPREVLESCLAQGGLRLVYVDDQLSGLLAAERRIEYGLCGWRMRERVTAPAMWSSGISTVALVQFAHSLVHDRCHAIWGTILPTNTSSLGSALRIGRSVIGSIHRIDGS